MTAYWPEAEDWTGFLLVILPVGKVSAFGDELRHRVRAQIEPDPVLYDLVTVALAAPFEPSDDWDRTFLTGLIETATPERHFFAPRGAIGIVVVGGLQRTIDKVVSNLRNFPALSRLGVCVFDVEVQADAESGVSAGSAQRVAGTVNELVALFDELPEVAVPELEFLRRADAVAIELDLQLPRLSPHVTKPRPALPGPAPAPAPSPVHALERAMPTRTLPAAPANGHAPVARRAPQLVEPPSPDLPIVRRPARQVQPVVYDGADIVTVDNRTPMQRLTRKNPTDADSIDELRLDGRPVSLAYLVFAPDDGVVSRPATKRRTAIALELDRLLATVRADAISGDEAHVAVEVFTATDPVRKHGILRVAGNLAESALPRVEIEYFSIATTVDPLLDAARRTTRALRARGVDVVSIHVIFLASMRFPADETTGQDWMRLLDQARVTWIDFGPADRREPMGMMPVTDFGLHVLSDKEDVMAVIRQESKVLYGYAAKRPPEPEPAEEPPADEPAAAEEPGSRRWWRIRKRRTE